MTFLLAALTILVLAYIQNISFSIVSRSRNRDNMRYHLIASVFSNGIWFLTFRELVTADMSLTLFIPYTLGTVAGSLTGAKVSMKIESWLGATADGHVPKKQQVDDQHLKFAVMDMRVMELERKLRSLQVEVVVDRKLSNSL